MLTYAEKGLYNALLHSPKHCDCPLIVKSGYATQQYGLYCLKHDTWIKWLSEHDEQEYPKIGLGFVEYTIPVPYDPYAHDGLSARTVQVKNLRKNKQTKLWMSFLGNPERDPSMPEYWKFIDSFYK
jgi:hypothetical protein